MNEQRCSTSNTTADTSFHHNNLINNLLEPQTTNEKSRPFIQTLSMTSVLFISVINQVSEATNQQVKALISTLTLSNVLNHWL